MSDEAAALAAVIEQAPHSSGCSFFLPSMASAYPCDCWKSRTDTDAALREVRAKEREIAAGIVEQYAERWPWLMREIAVAVRAGVERG